MYITEQHEGEQQAKTRLDEPSGPPSEPVDPAFASPFKRVLFGRVVANERPAPVRAPPPPPPPPQKRVSRAPRETGPGAQPLVARVLTALVLGSLLGAVGLPRLELPFSLPRLPQPEPARVSVTPAVPETAVLPVVPTLSPATPTAVPPTPTARPRVPAQSGPRVLFAQRFVAPLPDWPNDPNGTAWFGESAFRMFARYSGRFVAVGVPLTQPVDDVVASGQFRKLSGPSGGGYGFIIRDQGLAGERDSSSQAGRYLVLEVGDQGDVGVWQRQQTRWIDVLPWTHAEAVKPGLQANALLVSTHGTALRFEVNGEVVADMTYDGLPPTGGIGIFVGGDLNDVALEWLRIEKE